MPYDFEGLEDRSPPILANPISYAPNDLEAIVMLIELAAISLTPKPESDFTFEELLTEARAYGGGEVAFDESAFQIVLSHATFLKKKRNRYSLK